MNTVEIEYGLDLILENSWETVALTNGNQYIYIGQIHDVLGQFTKLLYLNHGSELLSKSERDILNQLERDNPILKIPGGSVIQYVLRLTQKGSILELVSERFTMEPQEIYRKLKLAELTGSTQKRKPISTYDDAKQEDKLKEGQTEYRSSTYLARTAFLEKKEDARASSRKSMDLLDEYGDKFPTSYSSLNKNAPFDSKGINKNGGPLYSSIQDPIVPVPDHKTNTVLRNTKGKSRYPTLNYYRSRTVAGLKYNLGIFSGLFKYLHDEMFTKLAIKNNQTQRLEDTSWRAFIYNVFSIVLFTIVSISILKVCFLLTTSIIHNIVTKHYSHNYYETDSESIYIQWWKEIPIIEYWAYEINNWIEDAFQT